MKTQEELKELLDYNPEIGVFIWKVSNSNRISKGSVAGCSNSLGYITISVKGKQYYAHRLAWLYVYGEWPKGQIDHINGNRSDNRIENLRNITQRENCQNWGIHREGKLVGSYFNKDSQMWYSQIRIEGVRYNVGSFKTLEEANVKYLQAVDKWVKNKIKPKRKER
jgi:hypothetical protein